MKNNRCKTCGIDTLRGWEHNVHEELVSLLRTLNERLLDDQGGAAYRFDTFLRGRVAEAIAKAEGKP